MAVRTLLGESMLYLDSESVGELDTLPSTGEIRLRVPRLPLQGPQLAPDLINNVADA